MTVENQSGLAISRGFMEGYVEFPDTENPHRRIYFYFDAFKPHEVKTLWAATEYMAFTNLAIIHRLRFVEGVSQLSDTRIVDAMDRPVNREHPISIHAATHEELYQKFSVKLALWVAVGSIALSALSFIATMISITLLS